MVCDPQSAYVGSTLEVTNRDGDSDYHLKLVNGKLLPCKRMKLEDAPHFCDMSFGCLGSMLGRAGAGDSQSLNPAPHQMKAYHTRKIKEEAEIEHARSRLQGGGVGEAG